MRKSGIVSFIIYLIYAIGGGGIALYNYIAIENHESGFEGIGYAILMILGIILGAAGLLGVILKGVHLGTGWGFFGFLCILLDVAFVVVFISMALPGGNNVEAATLEDFLPALPFLLATLASFVCNITSLRSY